MKKISALVLAASLSSTTAFAGGPVYVAPEGEPVAVVEAGPTSSINAGIVVPLLLLIVIAAAVATR